MSTALSVCIYCTTVGCSTFQPSHALFAVTAAASRAAFAESEGDATLAISGESFR